MARERPINAEVPAGERQGKGAAEAAEAAEAARSGRPRRPIPLALKLIGGAIVLAVVFIVAAILGGGGGGDRRQRGAAGQRLRTAQQEQPPSGRSRPTELGYPAFATKNTTRVGGADPAANAAGVALAVFPSTDDAQRPAAVTLVDEDDWRGGDRRLGADGGAGRAPVLVSAERRACPRTSVEALDALDPQGSRATGGAQVFAIGAAGARRG